MAIVTAVAWLPKDDAVIQRWTLASITGDQRRNETMTRRTIRMVETALDALQAKRRKCDVALSAVSNRIFS